MNFPKEWADWEMFPEELADAAIRQYVPGQESGSEHDRNGAFHWWLRKTGDTDALVKLTKLSMLDPDPVMARDVRRHIRSRAGDNRVLQQMLDEID